jgi:biotin carboxyl carrier protein
MSARPATFEPQHAAAPPREAPAQARLALEVQAALLSCRRMEDAAHALARELARQLDLGLVWVVLSDESRAVRLVAVSDGTELSTADATHAPLIAAGAECVDQQAVLEHPQMLADTRAVPRITRALGAAAPAGGTALAVPLVSQGRCIGALCVSRADLPALAAHDAVLLEHLAAFAAPVIALMQANERPWLARLHHDAAAWLAADGRPAKQLWRRSLPWLAALCLVALLIPTTMHIGGHARLEGAVQRVLVAPSDGFVQQVHARAGDSVRAGQPLLELADRDLQLERQRWQSQLSQHLDALATAQARADRTLLVQTQSKADEAQAQLDLVEMQLQRSRLVAPFDGIVVQGDLTQQLGAPVKQGAELMTLAPRDAFRVIVEVDERDVAHVHHGQRGTLALSALPWDTLPLQVTRITPVATAVEGRNVFEVEAELLERPPGLRPGLQGTAQIAAGTAPTLWRWTRRLVESARLTLWEWIG